MSLNIRQKAFVNGIKQLKPASHAYAEAYGGDPSDKSVQVNASRLLSNDKIKKTLEEIEKDMSQDAAEAYQFAKSMLDDPKVPAAVKKDVAFKIMALGGMVETHKVETKNETVYKGLNDDTSSP